MKKDNIRVVQLSEAYVGAQRQIEDAINSALNDIGIENLIVYSYGDSNDPQRIKCEKPLEMIWRRFGYKYIVKSHVFSRIQTRRFIRILENFNPDIVHLHTIHHGYYDFPMIFKYLRNKGIGIVYTVHDMWPFTGGCYYYSSLNCIDYQNGCKKCPGTKESLDCRTRSSAKLFDTKVECYEGQRISFVAVSEWVHQEIRKSVLKNYDSFVIHNGISLLDSADLPDKNFVRMIDELTRKKKTVVFVAASWDEGKGYDAICELASLLGEDYCLILIGNVREEIKTKAKSNMVFTGYLKRKADVRYVYRVSNLHASTSKGETFGMTFVEAAFEGTRSIGYETTAIMEIVKSVHGFCVENGDINEFANAIKAHIDDPKLSEDEVSIIKNMYSTTRMAKAYIDLYYRTCTQRHDLNRF